MASWERCVLFKVSLSHTELTFCVAGAGKSILSSSVISHLKDKHRDDPLVAIAYFYFSFADQKKQERDEMLASLLKQICVRRPFLPESVKLLQECREKNERPTTKDLEEVFIAALRGFSNVYVVIDALDECPEIGDRRKELMKTIRRILDAAANNLHIFCTSRKEQDIDANLRDYLSVPGRAELDLSSYTCRNEMNTDMAAYIETTLTGAEYRSWPESTKVTVKEKLLEKADGMYVIYNVVNSLIENANARR